jgi:hypothetical protein
MNTVQVNEIYQAFDNQTWKFRADSVLRFVTVGQGTKVHFLKVTNNIEGQVLCGAGSNRQMARKPYYGGILQAEISDSLACSKCVNAISDNSEKAGA